jgi:hypothetical protein
MAVTVEGLQDMLCSRPPESVVGSEVECKWTVACARSPG